MSLLNKLTIKNLKLNKKRTIVTIIGIILSVALITAVSTIYASGVKSLINFEIYEKGNFHVAFYNVPNEEIQTFKNNRAIEEINITKNIGYANIDSKNEYKPYAYIKAFTQKSLENLSIKLVEGRLPENENEILIPTHLKTNGRIDYQIGDTITLEVGKRVDNEGHELTQNNPYNPVNMTETTVDMETGKEETNYIEKSEEKIIDTATKTYKIVGIIERPASNIEDYIAPGYTLITYTDEKNFEGNVDLYILYNDKSLKNIYKITAGILEIDEDLFEKAYTGVSNATYEEFEKINEELSKSKYEINVNDYLISLETNPISGSGVGGLGIVAGIVITIIITTSVFCIKNSFDISITEKIKQYGMLKSIGTTKKQIKKNVFYEATILGMIGIPLGILSGFVASYILIIISNYYLKDMLSDGLKLIFSFSYIAIIIAILLGMITIYLSAFRSASKASKTSPIDSIRNSSNIKINKKSLKCPKIINKLFGIGGEISYKNLKRNKKKYRTTTISIVVSVTVFIALFSFMRIAFDMVENELNISEYNVYLSNSGNGNNLDKFIETTKFDNIENYTILRQATIKSIENYYSSEYINWLKLELDPDIDNYINIIAIGDDQYKKYIDSLGLKYEDVKDKLILSDYANISKYDNEKNKFINKYMRINYLKKGDVIKGFVDNDVSINLEIAFVAEEKPFGLKNRESSQFIISDELFDKLFTSEDLEIFYNSNNANKLQDEIDEYLKTEDYYLNNLEENVRIMNNLFTLIGIFLYGFIIVISLIGITNIFNTITTNMELRRQEFAMLKSVGMTKKEFNKMIRLESLFIGIKSLIIGITLGTILSYTIHYFLAEDSGMPYNLPLLGILISILIVFILIFVIMKYSINKINKQNTIETIRNENI